MKSIICTVLVLLFCPSAQAFSVVVPELGLDLDTEKVTHIDKPIEKDGYKDFSESVKKTFFLEGPRVIILNSPGGIIQVGNQIIELMEFERALGVQQICVVDQYAHSMAFNILSHCDIRLAQPKAKMIFHKARVFTFGIATAKELKRLAHELDKADKPLAEFNRKVLRMSAKTYDAYADAEFCWTGEKLLARGYIHALVQLRPKASSKL